MKHYLWLQVPAPLPKRCLNLFFVCESATKQRFRKYFTVLSIEILFEYRFHPKPIDHHSIHCSTLSTWGFGHVVEVDWCCMVHPSARLYVNATRATHYKTLILTSQLQLHNV